MSFKSSLEHLIGMLLTIFVTCLPLSTQAQVRCEAVFSKISVYKESFKALDDLTTASDELIEILESRPHAINTEIMGQAMKRLEILAEKYFKAAGIEFKPVASQAYIDGLRGQLKYIQPYSEYYLTGTKFGDEVSRLLYGVNQHRKFKDVPVKIKFDLLHAIKNEDVGHFRGEKNQIAIGPDVLINDAIGLSSTLYHEFAHGFEEKRIAQGEMTLARIDLFAPSKKDGSFYQKYLRQDEIKTHIVDIRLLVHHRNISRDKKLSKVYSSKNMVQIRAGSPVAIKDKVQLLESLIKRSKIVNNEMERLMYEDHPVYKKHEIDDGLVIEFDLSANSSMSYSTATLNLIGIFKAGEVSDKDVQKAIFKVLDWSNQQIKQIEKELIVIKTARGL